MKNPMKPLHILLVDDDPTDVLLTRSALRQTRLMLDLIVAEDGIEALRYLRRDAPYEDARRPDLVLLDLNMPRKGGLEVLSELRRDPELFAIPVVMLTCSEAETDVAHAYHLRASSTVQKPLSLPAFIQILQDLGKFWFTVTSEPLEAMR